MSSTIPTNAEYGEAPAWKPGPATTDGARIWTIATADGTARHAIREPVIAANPHDGSALFSLTLLLERQPAATEPSLTPFIIGGTCAMTVDVLPSTTELAGITGDVESPVSPLFLRAAAFSLSYATGTEKKLAETVVTGAGGRAGLTMSLAAEEANALLAALRGEATDLVLRCELTRSVRPAAPVRVEVDLGSAYELLAEKAAADRMFLKVDLINYLVVMLDRKIVRPARTTSAQTLYPGVVRALASILEPLPDVANTPAFRLGTRPLAAMLLAFHHDPGDAPTTATFTVERPLQQVLAPVARRNRFDSLVSAVCPGRAGGFEPLASRLPITSAARGAPASQRLLLGESLVAATVALRAASATRINAHALANSDLVARMGRQRWALDDLIVRLDSAQSAQHLPLIDEDTALWRDRVNPDRWWYAPEFAVLAPTSTQTTSDSPYSFSFRTEGHDELGRPGLVATIRMRIRPRMSDATQQQWISRGRPAVEPVPLNGLSVALEVAFRDAAGGGTRSEKITASAVEANAGDHDATFQLTDQWARLAYGSLAFAEFQQRPARLVIHYVFPAYTNLSAQERADSGAGANARTIAIPAVLDRSRIRLDRPPVGLPHVAPGLIQQPIRIPSNLLPHIPSGASPPRTGIRTQGRTFALDVLFPCNTYGAYYVQLAADGLSSRAIGCQDAFTLGQVTLRLYEPISLDQLGEKPPFSVWRSLQVPGRFLVVPQIYAVGRFEPGDARGYRAALFLFSNVDAIERSRTRCVVMASLQPAISPYWRMRLLDHLRSHVHASPELEWPTGLPAVPSYSWALATGGPPAGAVEAAVVRTPESFEVSLTTGIDGILTLKAMLELGGVLGAATFTLSDGTTFQSTLCLDLARITGPYDAGPVEIGLAAGTATLTNRIDQALDLGDLAVATNSGAVTRVVLDRRLAPGATTSIAVSPASVTAAVEFFAAGQPSSIEEVRTFVEDIYASITFQANFDFASLHVERVMIEARIVGVAGSMSVTVTSAEPMAELRMVLPLTTYLGQPTLQFAVTRTLSNNTGVTGPWHDWRMDVLGSVVELTATLIQQE